jgi:hypothetical protein
MRLTSDKSLFETTMEFYRSYEPSKGRLANALLDSIQSQGDDRIPVLRMHLHFEGKEYYATYRWRSARTK